MREIVKCAIKICAVMAEAHTDVADVESEVHGQEQGHWCLSWGNSGHTGVRQEEAGRERVRADREWRLAERESSGHLLLCHQLL